MRAFILSFLIFLFSAHNSYAIQKEGIAAVVNDDIVTYSDVQNRVQMALTATDLPDDPAVHERLGQQVLENLIIETLQMSEAKKLGIHITNSQVSGAMEQIAKQNGLTNEQLKLKFLEKRVPISTLEAQLRAQIAWTQVVRRKLRPKVNISESEIDAVLEDIKRNAGKPEFLVAEIYLNVSHPSLEAEVSAMVNDLLKKLMDGVPFKRVAKQFSQAPGAQRGGDLGWMRTGQLAPELENALLQMKPGQVSPPIRTSTGYHLLYLRDIRVQPPLTPVAQKTAPKAPPVAAAVPAVQVQREAFDIRKVRAHMKQIFIPIATDEPQTVRQAKIARAKALKNEIIGCTAMEKRFSEFNSPATGDLGKILLGSLPDSVVKTVENIKDGELSNPLLNSKGLFILMICSRDNPTAPVHASANTNPRVPQQVTAAPQAQSQTELPPEANDAFREKIASQLGTERLDALQQRYLRDLKAAAFIDKRI